MKVLVWIKDKVSVEAHEIERIAAKFSDDDKKLTEENFNYLKKFFKCK